MTPLKLIFLILLFSRQNDEIDAQKGQEESEDSTTTNEDEISDRVARKAQDFPFLPMSYSAPDVQSGFRNGGGRFVPIYATVTTWVRAPRTYISTITAICQSTTAFQTCGGNLYGGDFAYDYDD